MNWTEEQVLIVLLGRPNHKPAIGGPAISRSMYLRERWALVRQVSSALSLLSRLELGKRADDGRHGIDRAEE